MNEPESTEHHPVTAPEHAETLKNGQKVSPALSNTGNRQVQ